MFVLDGISPKIWFLSSHFAILLFFTSYFTTLYQLYLIITIIIIIIIIITTTTATTIIIIIIIIIVITTIIKPGVFKCRVGVRRGIAVSHGQVGVFSLGWQPS